MPFRKLILVVLTSFAGLSAAPSARADAPVFYTAGGAAIRGYDTVAYFNVGEPVRGQQDITVMWKGAVWQFSSQENRETFESNPRAYAPQYGGYCAFALSRGYIADTDPQAWRIVDGKLYLIHSVGLSTVWDQDVVGNLARSEDNWPDVLAE